MVIKTYIQVIFLWTRIKRIERIINQIIMNDIQLSKNFMLSEFTRSETERRRKINNDAPESVIENLRNRNHVVYYMKKNWLDKKFPAYQYMLGFLLFHDDYIL